MVDRIRALFERLRSGEYHVSSPADDAYNCIAWAAGVTDGWWWPTRGGRTYWPESVPRAVTLEAFREAFATLGYVVCATDLLEPGFEKIALFADEQGIPKHAARQLPDARWTSKLGRMEDIEHALHDLAGRLYGSVVLTMKRPVPAIGKMTEEGGAKASS